MAGPGQFGFGAALYLIGPTGAVVARGTNNNLRIPLSGFLSLPVSGTYLLEASLFGSYSVTLTSATANAVQLTQATFSANEGAERIDISFSRTGVTSEPAKVNYATSDTAGLTNCSVVNGIGSSRCDYAVTVGTVNFAAGETSKSLSIPLVDDSYAEEPNSFTFTLSAPAGTSLGTQSSATITITDNESSDGGNPVVLTPFFVRQHYIDFLGRGAGPVGFQGWRYIINNCPAGDTTCDRIHAPGNFLPVSGISTARLFCLSLLPRSIWPKARLRGVHS